MFRGKEQGLLDAGHEIFAHVPQWLHSSLCSAVSIGSLIVLYPHQV